MGTTNGKVTNVELEIALDEMRRTGPFLIESNRERAKIMWAKYNDLLAAGFDKEQAMRIICERPLIEQ